MKQTITKYSEFVHNHEQRPIDQGHVKRIMESMRTFGFLPSKPIQCYRKKGKLVVVDGHHRLAAAMNLNIDVVVVVESEKSQSTMTAVNVLVKKWQGSDFVRLYASRGNQHYLKLLEYGDKGIPFGLAASMMINNSASSGNASKSIADGTFKVKTLEIIDQVADLIADFSAYSSCVASRPFISAISKCIMCDSFSLDTFRGRLRENIVMLKKTSNEEQMITLIEAIYNHRSRQPLPLKFLVETAAKERSASHLKNQKAP